MEWVFDKLQSGGSWTTSVNAWKLLTSVWISLDTDPESRMSIYTNHDFTSILADVLKALTGDSRELIDALTDCLHTLSESIIWIKPVNVDLAWTIVSSYLALIEKCDINGLTCFSEELKNILKPILITAKRKHLVNLFPQTFRLLRLSLPEEISSIVLDVLRSILSSDDETSLKTQLHEIDQSNKSEESLSKLYKLIFSINKKQAVDCFDDFVRVTPSATLTLLNVVIENNIKLTKQSLKLVVEIQLNGSYDWEVLTVVLALNSDAIFEYSDRLFEKIKSIKHSSTPATIGFATKLIQAYSASRELPKFFTAWSTELVESGWVWTDRAILDTITAGAKTLSAYHMKQLLNQLANPSLNESESQSKRRKVTNESLAIPAITLIKGMNEGIALQIKSELLNLLNLDNSNIDYHCWELKYLILSLVPHLIFESESRHSLVSSLAKVSFGDDAKHISFRLYLLQVIFRLRELGVEEVLPVFDQLVTGNIEYMCQNDKYARGLLTIISKRWLILANVAFGKQHLTLISQLYLQHEDKLMELVSNSLFYEQPVFTRELNHEIIRQLKMGGCNVQSVLKALSLMPIEVYSRIMRQELLDWLVENANDDMGYTAILHLLYRPTFQAKLETDPMTLIQLARSSPETVSSSAICKAVLQHHINNLDNPSSAKFISGLVAKVNDLLSSDQNEKWLYRFCSVLVTEMNDDSLNKIRKQTLNGISGLLDEEPSKELMQILDDLMDDDTQYLEKVFLLVDRAIHAQDYEAGAIGFSILCRLQESKMMELTSLFVFLYKQKISDTQSLMEAYATYLGKLTNDDCSLLFNTLLAGWSESPLEYFQAIRCLFGHMEDDSQCFVRVVSSLSENFQVLDHNALTSILSFIDKIIKEQTSAVSQYGLELVMTLVYKISLSLNQNEQGYTEEYICLTLITSSILLFHRYRLNGRYHLIISTFIGLLKSCRNVVCGAAYSRLLSNLCEPPVQSIRERGGKNNLTSSTTAAKRQLSKHVHIILLDYIQLVISSKQLTSEIRSALRLGIFAIFDVLSADGLKNAAALIQDSSARAVFKVVYDDYKKNGKWRDD